jgi:hypothetical protein
LHAGSLASFGHEQCETVYLDPSSTELHVLLDDCKLCSKKLHNIAFHVNRAVQWAVALGTVRGKYGLRGTGEFGHCSHLNRSMVQ